VCDGTTHLLPPPSTCLGVDHWSTHKCVFLVVENLPGPSWYQLANSEKITIGPSAQNRTLRPPLLFKVDGKGFFWPSDQGDVFPCVVLPPIRTCASAVHVSFLCSVCSLQSFPLHCFPGSCDFLLLAPTLFSFQSTVASSLQLVR
jgi:hypothetical protein